MIDYIAQQIGQVELYFLTVAAIIAGLSLFTKYRYVAAILFVEFLVMTGYQTSFLDTNGYLRPNLDLSYVSEDAIHGLFYSMKAMIQVIFISAYIQFEDCITLKNFKFTPINHVYKLLVRLGAPPIKPLAATSAIIFICLCYQAFISFNGLDSVLYEPIMIGLSIIQLSIGLIGVISGGWFIFNPVRGSHSHRHNKAT